MTKIKEKVGLKGLSKLILNARVPVAQLTEQSLLTPKDLGSTQVIGYKKL